MGRVGGEQTKAEQTIIGGGRVSSCKEGSATAFSGLFAKKLRNERLRCRLQQIARAERWVTLIRPVDVRNIMGLILLLFGILLVGNSKAQDGPLVSSDLILPNIFMAMQKLHTFSCFMVKPSSSWVFPLF